jgi:primosomal protein N'
VGTERDLSGLEVVDLAVAADVDGMLLGSGYRTTEDALRQLGRLALAVGSGRGARLILQTARPDSLLVTTMRRGDPMPYLERVLVERAREGVPPSVEMVAIEIRETQPDSVDSDLSELDADVMGPVPIENGRRWLITGDLGAVRPRLREMVGRWRDNGATVRVDVDPIDI